MTPWQRQQVFWQNFLFNLMPPVFFTVQVLRDRRLRSLNQKLQVSGVMLVVRAISAWEMLRLKAGAVSSRE